MNWAEVITEQEAIQRLLAHHSFAHVSECNLKRLLRGCAEPGAIKSMRKRYIDPPTTVELALAYRDGFLSNMLYEWSLVLEHAARDLGVLCTLCLEIRHSYWRSNWPCNSCHDIMCGHNQAERSVTSAIAAYGDENALKALLLGRLIKSISFKRRLQKSRQSATDWRFFPSYRDQLEALIKGFGA